MAADQSPIGPPPFGLSQRIGHFHYDTVTGKWEWDDELYRLHGYEPDEVEVSLDLILAHKHPDDRDDATAVIENVMARGEPFSSYQRIVTADGSVRNVVKFGAGILDRNLDVVAIDGFYIDMTSEVLRHEKSAANDAVAASAAHRASIEQAKGMLMLTYGIDAGAAFAMLGWWSNDHNVKINLLAERLVAAVAEQQHAHPEVRVRVERLMQDLTRSPDQPGIVSPPLEGVADPLEGVAEA
ncbi:MAG: PAS and ANTAR domain-containing protein [Nocardioidaceae bacterium]